MQPYTRAMIAASAYAIITREKVAGLYDHTVSEQLRIAAEARDNEVQGADGERSTRFGGILPELYNYGDQTFVSLEVDGTTARGYDRGSGGHYMANVKDRLVQLYDYDQTAWFAFEVLKF